MTVWAPHAGTAWWLVAAFTVAGALVGGVTGRELATGGYRIESDEAGALPRHAWWPAVALAALWGWLAWQVGSTAGWAALPTYLAFAWLAVGLVWIDADVHRLPDGLVLPAYPVLLVLVAVASLGAGEWGPLVRALVCGAALYALYFVLALVSPGSLGFGDVKLSGLIGLVLGWLGVGAVVMGTVAGFVVGGVVALLMLAGRRVGLRSHIAFGPAMLVGAFVGIAARYSL